MSGHYNRRAERERQERDTPERILQIAKSRGRFSVSLRYRDDWLRKRCAKLKAQGLLTGGRRDGREVIFYPVKAEPASGSEPFATSPQTADDASGIPNLPSKGLK